MLSTFEDVRVLISPAQYVLALPWTLCLLKMLWQNPALFRSILKAEVICSVDTTRCLLHWHPTRAPWWTWRPIQGWARPWETWRQRSSPSKISRFPPPPLRTGLHFHISLVFPNGSHICKIKAIGVITIMLNNNNRGNWMKAWRGLLTFRS